MNNSKNNRQKEKSEKKGKKQTPATENHLDTIKSRLCWWELTILAIILISGLTLRILYLQEVRQAPFFESPGVDASFHDYWARGIATHDWTPPQNYSDPKIYGSAYLRPPGYPFFLALIYWISGEGYLAPRLFQMGLGLMSCVLAFLLGRKWYGRSTGLIFAAMMSFYWIFIYFEAEFHAPVLFIFLLLVLLYLLGIWKERMTWMPALGAGIVGGLCTVVRPNALFLILAAILWAFWISRRRKNYRRFAFAAIALLLGVASVILPVTIRNYVVSNDFVLISSNAGINFYIGNNDQADGLVTGIIPGLGKFGTCYDWPQIVANLEKKLDKKLKASEVSSYFMEEGVKFIAKNPGDFFRLALKKTFLFWGPKEVGHNKEIQFERKFSKVLSKIPGSFAMALSLGIVGFGFLLLDHRRKSHLGSVSDLTNHSSWEMSVLIGSFILVYFFSVLPFFAAARYRVPVIPLLLLFGAYAIYRFAKLIAIKNWHAWMICLVIFIVLYGLTTRSFVTYEPSLARWHFDRGAMFDRTGQSKQALIHYREAVEADPTLFAPHYNLAHKLMESGKTEEAIKHWEETVRLNPTHTAAYFNLAVAYRKTGHIEKADQNLAIAYRKSGDLDKAVSHIQEALKQQPGNIKYLMTLGDLLASRGKTGSAIEQYRKVLSLQSDFFPALRNLAWILATHQDSSIRNPEEAVLLAERANKMSKGRSPTVLDTMAAAYASAGRFGEAIQAAQQALSLAQSSGERKMAKEIQARLELYQQNKPFGFN